MSNSPVSQAVWLYRESGIDRTGQSRHAEKIRIRAELVERGISPTPQRIDRQMGIHSFKTASAYRDTWIRVFRHAREHFNLRKIIDIEPRHIKHYLDAKVEGRVACATLKQYTSALQKLEKALGDMALKKGYNRTYDFSSALEPARLLARSLDRPQGSRAYRTPQDIILHLRHPDHDIAARLQLEGGARIREASHIKPDQLEGFRTDRVTGEMRGVIRVRGKGNKIRRINVSPEAYRLLAEKVKARGIFLFNKGTYRRDIERAAGITMQPYTGSHGLRWNFAQHRFITATARGYTGEQAMALISHEMGHNRADITLHYLQ